MFVCEMTRRTGFSRESCKPGTLAVSGVRVLAAKAAPTRSHTYRGTGFIREEAGTVTASLAVEMLHFWLKPVPQIGSDGSFLYA
jgi:hypothetical protein